MFHNPSVIVFGSHLDVSQLYVYPDSRTSMVVSVTDLRFPSWFDFAGSTLPSYIIGPVVKPIVVVLNRKQGCGIDRAQIRNERKVKMTTATGRKHPRYTSLPTTSWEWWK